MLDAGVPIHKAFRTTAKKSSDANVRESFRRISRDIANGVDVASAMRDQQQAFPDLYVDMVEVAEKTGNMPEVLRGLSEHYDNIIRLRKSFVGQIAWPVFQLIMAILVIAGLILLLGWIANMQGNAPVDVLGWGLVGTSGAITWLFMTFGSAAMAFVAFKVITANLRGKKFLDGLILQIPVVGSCARAFAIARLSWAYHLTQESGMPITDSLEASLRATSNGAFIGATPMMLAYIEEGETLTDTFRESGLFPVDFIEMVNVAENTGTVPEMLHRMSPQFEEDARRSLAALAGFVGWMVWLGVAIFIIFVIISLFMFYVGMINDVASGAL